jgi:hypothetical protein
MAKQSNPSKEKYLEFGAHFSIADLCERLRNYSSTTVYQERLKEILQEESVLKSKQLPHLQRKNLKLNSNNEFNSLNPIKKANGSLRVKRKLLDNKCSINLSIPNLRDKNKFVPNNCNRKDTIESEVVFPIIHTELNQKTKKNRIKLSKNFDINDSPKRNIKYTKEYLKIPQQKSEVLKISSAEKINLNQYFNNLSHNLSDKRVLKLKLPNIKK